jgi:hypothetical protein
MATTLSNAMCNALLDEYFYNFGDPLYAVLYDDSNVEIDTVAVNFGQAVSKQAETTGSFYFTVTAGTTVAKLEFEDVSSNIIETYDLSNETFTINGGYTVNYYRKSLGV